MFQLRGRFRIVCRVFRSWPPPQSLSFAPLLSIVILNTKKRLNIVAHFFLLLFGKEKKKIFELLNKVLNVAAMSSWSDLTIYMNIYSFHSVETVVLKKSDIIWIFYRLKSIEINLVSYKEKRTLEATTVFKIEKKIYDGMWESVWPKQSSLTIIKLGYLTDFKLFGDHSAVAALKHRESIREWKQFCVAVLFHKELCS